MAQVIFYYLQLSKLPLRKEILFFFIYLLKEKKINNYINVYILFILKIII